MRAALDAKLRYAVWQRLPPEAGRRFKTFLSENK
jgi:hypothetical protein